MKTISADVKDGSFKPVYLLYGDEKYLINQFGKKLADAVCPPENGMNRSEFSGKDIDTVKFFETAMTMPFFSERRLIIARDTGWFKGCPDEIEEKLAEVPQSTVIIFREDQDKSVDQRKKLFKYVKSAGHVAKLDHPDDNTLRKWISGKLRDMSLEMPGSVMTYFLERVGDDMNLISTELEKLGAYCMGRGEVSREDIEEICARNAYAGVFDLTDAIASGNRKKAMHCYRDLVLTRQNPMALLSLMSGQFRRLFIAGQMAAAGCSDSEISKEAGINPYFVKKTVSQARRFSEKELYNAMCDCVKADYDIKSGQLTDDVAALLLIEKYSRLH